MKTKEEIVANWLVRYTGTPLDKFGEYILLTNFQKYVEIFAQEYNAYIRGLDKTMPNVTEDNITMINFGMGSPNAATIMDLLTAIHPKDVLFLLKTGVFNDHNKFVDLILPISDIRV